MAGRDRDAPGGEVGRVLGMLIATGDADAAEGEKLGEGAHPRPGDADEVDGPRVGGIEEAGHDGGAIYGAAKRPLKSEVAGGRAA